MKERLVIKNFGPIKSVDLELGRMTILIGEQATGKSTIAKILAVCRYVNLISTESHQLEIFKNTLKYWDIDSYLKHDSYIYYTNNDFSKELIGKRFIYKPLSNDIINYLESLKNFYDKTGVNFSDIDNKDLEVINSMTISVNNSIETSFFIPTERGLQSLFSLGKGSINNMSDILFNQLSKLSSISKSIKQEILIKPLNVKFINRKGQGFVKKIEEKSYFGIENSASGYQSMIPIVLSINYYKNKHKNFIIEEPEINLFPKTQKKLMEFFVENINLNGHSFLLPTHSPYFLSSINDLLLAYKKGQKNQEAVEKIIKKESWLNPDDFSAYQLSNGGAFDIFDKKTGLIADNIIDEVSDEMNDEFDELLDVR